jgi:hypothetical protein
MNPVLFHGLDRHPSVNMVFRGQTTEFSIIMMDDLGQIYDVGMLYSYLPPHRLHHPDLASRADTDEFQYSRIVA